MEPQNTTELRITRQGTIGSCKCKVGSCRKCGSRCKRCKCQCDGFSILDTLDRISKHRYDKDALKNKKKRRFQKAKRLKASEKLIKEPTRSSKRSKVQQSWVHLNDDDSTYLPLIGTNNVINNDGDESPQQVDIVVMRTLLDPNNLKTAIAELAKTMSSVSLPASKSTLKKLFNLAMSSNLLEYSDSSATTIRDLLEILHLPIESANNLQQLLISTMTKRKDTRQYATRNSTNSSKGKQITSISNIRQQIMKLTQKCDFMMEQKKTNTTSTVDSVTVNNENPDNGSDVGADVEVAQEYKRPDMTKFLGVGDLEIDDDSYRTNEKLTDQVLTLPRQFRPINLKNDRILQTNGDASSTCYRTQSFRTRNVSGQKTYEK